MLVEILVVLASALFLTWLLMKVRKEAEKDGLLISKEEKNKQRKKEINKLLRGK